MTQGSGGKFKALVAGAAGVAAGFFAGRAFQEATTPEPDADAERQPLPAAVPSGEMPRWIPRLLRTILFYVAAVVFVLYAAGALRDLLFNLLLAFFASLALEPAVKYLHAKGWKRGLATFAVMAAFGVLGLLLLAILVPTVIRQLAGLVSALPGWLQDGSKWLRDTFNINVDVSVASIKEQLSSVDSSLADTAVNVVGNLFGVGAAIAGAVFRMLTIGLFTFYFVADGPRFRRAVCSVLPQKQQQSVLTAWEVAIEKTGGYLYSRLLLAAVAAGATLLVLVVLGVPFALPMAIWVGIISQFIPTVGTYIAMVVPIAVALFSDPWDSVILLAYFTLYQQVENYVLSPRITAKTMELHPAIAFGSAMAGGAIAGPIGAFLALPVAATLQSGVLIYVVRRHEVIDSELTEQEQPPSTSPADEMGMLDDIGARLRRMLK